MNPEQLRYTKDHEWVGKSGGLYAVGITDYAQEQLGDITFVELPEVGRQLGEREEAAVVESVKAASDVYAPVAGKVAAVNEDLEGAPENVNKDPYGEGWFFKLEGVNESKVNALMDAEAYKQFVAEQGD